MRINPAIASLENVAQSAAPKAVQADNEEKGGDFAQLLMDVLREVNTTQQDARSMQNALMTGQRVEYHDLMIAMEKASVAMQLTMAVRNKILEAYQEIQRIQV
jgi:flagellar hook-basal body complex protein FliE